MRYLMTINNNQFYKYWNIKEKKTVAIFVQSRLFLKCLISEYLHLKLFQISKDILSI